MAKENETALIYCNQCLSPTKHEIVAVRKTEDTEFFEEYNVTVIYTIKYTMFECRGCGSCVLEKKMYSDEPEDPTVEYYPPFVARRKPTWLDEMPSDPEAKDIKELFQEIYQALHGPGGRLAIMGTRALLELFMNRAVGDVGGFAQKLNALEEGGYISKNNKAILETALDAGHAATHRGFWVPLENINLVMDIVENLIHTIVLTRKASKFNKNIPGRKISKK